MTDAATLSWVFPLQTDHNLVEGDCLRALKHVPDNSVHLVLCDLPYGTTQNPWDSVIDLGSLWCAYMRVLAPGGVVVLTSQGVFTAQLILGMSSWFRYKMVWVKSKATNFLNVRHQPLRKYEDICVFYPKRMKGRPPTTYNPQMSEGAAYDKGVRKAQQTGSYNDFDPVRVKSDGARCPTDVLYFPTAESEGSVWHATQKPVALGRYLVRTYSNPGDLVLDNAFGSGSFLVAAAMEGRKTLGIELNRNVDTFKGLSVDLVEVARRRLHAVGASPDIHRIEP